MEGEEITRNYVPAVYGVPKRKLHLTNNWSISCSCERCSDVTEFGTFVSALKCSSCREGLVVPENEKEGVTDVNIRILKPLFRVSVEM